MFSGKSGETFPSDVTKTEKRFKKTEIFLGKPLSKPEKQDIVLRHEKRLTEEKGVECSEQYKKAGK